MPISICWRPAAQNIFEGGSKAHLALMEKVFSGRTIYEYDVPKLRAMALASGDKFYDEVADAIDKVGAIDFWEEH